jgi:hypothetical protein
LEKVKDEKVSSEVLLPVHKIIYRELKEDVFARYIRSQQFQTLCNKKGKEFMHQIAIDDTINGSMMYQPADFRSNTIVDRDIQFILKMSEDSNDWTCIKNPIC